MARGLMRALLSTRVGGPETLEMTDLPMPEPKKGEIRVAVKAAGVNFPDTIIIRDLYQFKPPRPFAPGGEVAGVVDAIGDEVEGFAMGDRVLGLPIFGGFVSHICFPAISAHKIPDALPCRRLRRQRFVKGWGHIIRSFIHARWTRQRKRNFQSRSKA